VADQNLVAGQDAAGGPGVAAGAFPRMQFDIATLPPTQRREALIDAIDRAYYPCETRFLVPHLQRGRMNGVDMGTVRTGYAEVEPVEVRRGGSELRRGAGDYVYVPLPLQAGLELRQRDRQVRIGQDGFAFTITAEAYTYRQPQPLELLTLRIAAPAVRQRVPNVEDLTATLFAARGSAALFLDYARAFCRNAPGFDRPTGEAATRHLLDLFALAVLAGARAGPSSEMAVRAAQRQRIVQLVEARLGDPGLGVETVARRLSLSERYVQKLLSEGGQTLSAMIRERRMAEACRLLAAPAAGCRSINAVAYQVGFADPAYFSRVFRGATGLSPRAYRAQQREAAATGGEQEPGRAG